MNDASQHDFAAASLENLRRRLLDLTARNRLLNFTHGRQGNVRIIDELPNELHRMLLSEEELRFQAIPDPTREELIAAGYIEIDPETGLHNRVKKDPTAVDWARLLGLNSDYELPAPSGDEDNAAKHLDKAIQTLMFPSEMEARLRGLRNKAETAIEETGANICYVAFGFLEWFESPDSDKARHAPLLLVPVRIAKGRLNRDNGTYNYTTVYTGEDILPNLSLREMLRVNFSLDLPDLNESTVPEDYFSQIAQLIEKPQARWRVRRYATVALFNFSKLLMYLDLDPARRPSDRRITAHAIVSRFFAGSNDKGADNGFGDEHPIDDLPDVHDRYPLVEDADSSQHSALVDAIDGKNLVIQGPPGTGKSQTITNLIAAALAQGKRVLFVAEKLAALEVVKRRLDHAGLGDFCLELHSHKTQKRKVLDDIATRLNHQSDYRRPEQIDADIERCETLKEQLRGYAELINSNWKRTGLTIHEILMAARRHRDALGVDPATLHPDGYDGQMFDGDVQRQSLDTVRLFGDVYRQIAIQLGQKHDLRTHPWYGVGNQDLQLFDKERVCASLSRWQEALDALAEVIADVGATLGTEGACLPNDLEGIETLKQELSQIPPLHGDEILTALPRLRGENLRALTGHLHVYREVQDHRRVLDQCLRPEVVADPDARRKLSAAWAALKPLGLDRDTQLGALANYLKRIDRLRVRVRELGRPMAEVANSLGHAFTDVIKLDAAGLDEFRAFVELVGQLRPALLKLRSECFDDDILDDLLPQLKKRLDALNAARAELQEHFAIDRAPPPEALEAMRAELAKSGLFRWFDAGWRASRRALLALSARPGTRYKELVNRLEPLCRYARDGRSVEEDTRFRNAFGTHFAGTDTSVADLVALRDWYKAVRRRYGIGFGAKAALGDAVLGMSTKLARGIQSLGQQGIQERANEVIREIEELKAAFAQHLPIQSKNAPLVAAEGPWSRLLDLLRANLAIVQGQLNAPEASLSDVEATVDRVEALESRLHAWRENSIDPHWFGQEVELAVEPDELAAETVTKVEHTIALARVIDEDIGTSALQEAIYRNPGAELLVGLRANGERLAAAWEAHVDRRTQFSELTELDLAAWQRPTSATLEGLSRRNRAALAAPDWLSNWLDYVRLRHLTASIGFARLTRAIEQGDISAQDIDAGYKLAVHDLLARQILKEMPRLAQFSGNAQLAVQRQFRQYDEKLKQLQRERIAWAIARNPVPEGNVGGKVSDYSDRALLKHECGKKKRHIPLRQLVLRAGNALAALKPCFMMGPMSVAQYLVSGQIEFDLVVMDEASQMKPEDALGSVARGQQLIVVGDPKQLPPTSFFDKMIDEQGEEDAAAIEVSESILDTALPMFNARRLRWHYRSKHEQLIAFSNHAFYDSGLVVFPAPHRESDEFGVKFYRVPRGRFVNRRNVEEARVIAAAVRHHLLQRPDESIGVVAMSGEQRDQIERAVEELAKDEPLFQEALEKNLDLEEPLFVKNLENVQGDEREVIFISCTYGPEEIGGRVFQRFGPINSDVGWRRLNVLFTRAKKRMHVFSSMGSDDIVLTERSRRGVEALKGFLAFAESGRLHQAVSTGRPPDSDFEIAVAAALGDAGFECVPQVGVAGFFIDLAVRDPGHPGRYLMGIECDGASYHSAKSVRDRDRLRQAVLERLGWRIHRIWSTDWYRNPPAEIEPIIRELDTLKTDLPSEQPEVAEPPDLAEIAKPEAQQELPIDAIAPEEVDLRERLIRFDDDVIRAKVPDTPDNQRLLRPAMLEALLEYRPLTKSEFVELIPLYLRQATSSHEGKYLEQVLRMIEETDVEAVVAE
jgi:very-short-patch-repair endonuclease